ncbi:MAG: hypothetical protein AB7G48_09255 [Nitrospiraceae bacterium]
MIPRPKAPFTERLRKLRPQLAHAFAVHPEGRLLSREDEALLERLASTIIDRRMAMPALLFFESMGPMNFLGSQVLHFLTPLLNLACHAAEFDHAARLLERRDTIPRLIALIEAKASVAATR